MGACMTVIPGGSRMPLDTFFNSLSLCFSFPLFSLNRNRSVFKFSVTQFNISQAPDSRKKISNMSGKPTVAFAGLGAMGGGMAKNLVKEGFSVTGYDVYQPLVDSFVEAGGKPSKTPKELAEGADFLVSMVANSAQNEGLLFDGPDAAIHGLGKGKTFILCSTCPPHWLAELRKKFDEEFNRPDVKVLDCPVSGGTIRAGNGTLSIFAAGPDADLDNAKEVLECMSANLYRMGELGQGTNTKTIHQLLAATNIATASEALGLAATAGLNTKDVVEHVNKSDGASFMFENRTAHMLKNDWTPLSALAIIHKDTVIVTDAARKNQFPVAMANTAEQIYWAGINAGMLRDDDAKTVQLFLPKSQGDLVAKCVDADANMSSNHGISKDTIVDLLNGIHLASSVEGMAFCQKLGIDEKVMCEIISKAAGWSAIYTKYIPGMLEKKVWSLSACNEAEQIRSKLAAAVEKCIAMKFPCPMAAMALQQFHLAEVANK